MFNRTEHIRHQCRKTTVLSATHQHWCWKNEHQISIQILITRCPLSKIWYTFNYLNFSKWALGLWVRERTVEKDGQIIHSVGGSWYINTGGCQCLTYILHISQHLFGMSRNETLHFYPHPFFNFRRFIFNWRFSSILQGFDSKHFDSKTKDVFLPGVQRSQNSLQEVNKFGAC